MFAPGLASQSTADMLEPSSHDLKVRQWDGFFPSRANVRSSRSPVTKDQLLLRRPHRQPLWVQPGPHVNTRGKLAAPGQRDKPPSQAHVAPAALISGANVAVSFVPLPKALH